MNHSDEIPRARGNRRSIRLKGYDYSRPAAYFVTVVTQARVCWLGSVRDGEMILSRSGRIAALTWEWLARRYAYVDLDAWVVMPNHLHGIIVITDDLSDIDCRGGSRAAPTDSAAKVDLRETPPCDRKPLGQLIGAFKTVSTKRLNAMHPTPGTPFWQRNFYEHVIRSTDDLDKIRQYILNNPARWDEDPENPGTCGP